ncbi:uncharacterized protein METZ01_LOCUS334645 [marine metagenome]|uniref:Uncharacterized protein n=1 Tax=marine metagenome TaxID=408172 RepID=A0A382QC29_9ZZZZ
MGIIVTDLAPVTAEALVLYAAIVYVNRSIHLDIIRARRGP